MMNRMLIYTRTSSKSEFVSISMIFPEAHSTGMILKLGMIVNHKLFRKRILICKLDIVTQRQRQWPNL